jgi:uncharacterized protein YgiM (DUF1202 family)
MDNKDNKRGFSGLADLTSDISALGDVPHPGISLSQHTPAKNSFFVCSDCKTENTADSVYCKKCGNNLNKKETDVKDSDPIQVESSEIPKNIDGPFGKWIIGIMVGFMSVIFLFWFAGFNGHNAEKENRAPSQPINSNENRSDSHEFENKNTPALSPSKGRFVFVDSVENEQQKPTANAKNILSEDVPDIARYYVTALKLNVRENPWMDASIAGSLLQFDTVNLHFKSKVNGWVKIDNGLLEGWVAEKYLEKGEGSDAQELYCRANVTRPVTGHIFYQKATGPHSLTINNSPGSDVIVKLKDLSGDTVISFYVRANEQFTVTSIPNGKFKMQYAAGKSYCQICGEIFLDDMQASEDPSFTRYEITSDGYNRYASVMEYTLYRVSNGNLQTKVIPADQF